jgi:hypothetical protein
VTGRLHLASPAHAGALIGPGGSIVKDLRERSGLRRADFGGRGSTTATLGPGPVAAVQEFIRLAAEIVPSVRGELVDARVPSVIDLVSGQTVGDVANHRWTTHDVKPEPPGPLGPSGVYRLTAETDPTDLTYALRRREELTVSFAGLPPELVPGYAAYLLGLASAVPEGRADWPEPHQMVIRRPYPPITPPASLHDRPERHVVSAFNGSVDLLARPIRLGQPVEIDLRDADASVRSAVRLFLAGLCAELSMNIDSTQDGRVLHVYRR